MEKSNSFMTDDGSIFDVPESKLDAFAQDADDKGENLRTVRKYADADGSIFDVPEDRHDAFMQDAQAQGVQLEEVYTVHTMGQTFDVPRSKTAAFHSDWMKDPEADKEREQTAMSIASNLDKPDNPIWAGLKAFFSPKGYADNASLEGASAAVANVFRGVAQSPATIADKLAAAEQFQSRVRELPGMKAAAAVIAPMSITGLAGLGWESILSLKGKDGGKEYRDLIQKARDYVDAKREEWLGYRNEKGEQAGQEDFALTLGGQAINSVAESYLLTAPKVMQGINAAMRSGGAGLASKLTPTLQTMLYGSSTAEETARKAEAKGMSNEKAVGLGMLTGTIESALESVSQVKGLQDAISKNAMKEAVARTVWKKAGEVLKDATGEGLTEFGQQAQQGAIEKLSKIDEKTWGEIGMESASAAALGFVSGGAGASANNIFGNTGGQANELRADEEAAAVGMGRMAQQESVLEGDPAAAPQGEGAIPGQGPVPGGVGQPQGAARTDAASNPGVGLDGYPAVAGASPATPEGYAEAAMRDFQVTDPLVVNGNVKAIPEKTGRGVRLILPSGKSLVSMDPGLAALVEYWYKDRVLFPAAPSGDKGRQIGDVTMNASRRAGFDVKPGKTVLVNVGRSKKSYLGHVVQVLDNNTVRVKIDKTQRSLKNNRAGYADVDVRQLAQLPSVIGRQRRDELMKGMTPEQRKATESNAQAFERELVDQGYFLNQDSWMDAEAMGDTKRGKLAKSEELKAAYRRASQILGIPLDNHVQRAAALELLRDFHARMQGTETTPYDVQAELLAREGEQEMQELRGSGDFSLAEMTPEEMEAADARLEAQRRAQEARQKMLDRAAAPLEGDAGDLTGELFGAFDETPLFGGALDQRPDDVLFNADLGAGSMAQGNAYNQDTSGGAETPKAQQTRVPMEGAGNAGRFAVGMDLMDAVQLFYQLRGKMPKIRERMRAGVMGLFRPGTQDIELLAGIFGMYDQQDADRIKEALVKKGYEGERLANQIDVEVRALIEKRRTQNMKKPLKVMVHELAHYVDFLPDSELKRGNILGHIAALKRHLGGAIGPEPGAAGPLTEQEKAALRRRAEAEMKALLGDARTVIEEVTREVPEYAVLGIKPDDVKALLGTDGRTATPELYDWFSRQDASVKREVFMAAMKGVIDGRMAALGSRVQTGTRTVTEQVARDIPGYTKEDGRRRFRELLKQETEKRRLIELKQIKAEAESIIPWWRGAKEMEAYFRQPEEMYAELFGIFLADPSELRARAPTVYRAFSGWMDARPEAAEAYRAYLDFRNLPAEQQARQKLANFKRGMEKGDEDSRREATELARKPGRWAAMDSFGYYFHRRTAPIKWALDRSLKVLVDGAPTDAEKAKVKDIYETALVGIKRHSAISRVIQSYEAEINSRVADPLAKNGFDMLDLGVYQALRRVAYELDGKAAPAGVEPASALKLLESMRQEYGEQRWNALQEAAMEFRRIREARIISNPDLRAMYDKELLEKLDNNVEYVTFQRVPTMQEIQQFKDALRKAKSGDKLLREDVAEFLTREMENRLGSAVGAKIYRFVGSFGPVANPIVATLTKDDQLIRSAVRNTLRRQIYEFVKESGLDLIREVQYEKNSQGVMVPKMVDDPNWKTVVYMQDGQIKGYLANRSMAKALESGRTDEIVGLRWAMRVNSDITKLYTQLKYSFSFKNNIRDLERAANYVPGMERMRLAKGVNINFLPGGGMVSTLMRYKIPSELVKKVLPWTMNDRMIEWHLYQARRAAILIQSNTIDQAEAQAQELMRMGDTRKADQLFDDVRLAREGLENPILMSHIEAIREDSTADDYTRRLYRYGIQKDDLILGLHMGAKLAGMFKAYGRMVEGWGEVGELTTKLATWKYLEKHGQNMTPQQRILTTRELGGSPDFSERGAAASYIEAITKPFWNAAKEGTFGALSAFKDRPMETSRKLFSGVVAPTMVRHLLFTGLGSELLKLYIGDDEEKKSNLNWLYNVMQWFYDRMKNVSNYKLKSYHSFPVPTGLDEKFNNFTLLLKVPMDQTSQVISTTVWNMMDSAGETLLDELNSGNPNAAPAVISRTERPYLEILNAFYQSVGPDGVAQGPLPGIFGLITGFLTGSNFHDSFKDQDVFNEDELISRFSQPNAAKVLMGEMWNRLGGPMIKRYDKENIFGEELPTIGKILNAPFIQPTVGMFLSIETGGQAQMERKFKRIDKEFEAPVKVEAKNDFARAVKEGGGKSVNFSEDIIAKMINQNGKTYADLVKSQIYKEEFERLTAEYYRTKNIRETVGQPLYNAMKEDNPIMRDIRIDVTKRGL